MAFPGNRKNTYGGVDPDASYNQYAAPPPPRLYFGPPGSQPPQGYQPVQMQSNYPAYSAPPGPPGPPPPHAPPNYPSYSTPPAPHTATHPSYPSYSPPPLGPKPNSASPSASTSASPSFSSEKPPPYSSHPAASRGFGTPPAAPQQFLPGTSNATFQYSNCSGRRKALLIGINYIGSRNQLRGCINDVKNLSSFLLSKGYTYNDMVFLTDDQTDPRKTPTRQNIIQCMQWLVADAQPNDSLVLHYSGHGGQVPDQDGDEDDGYDECIYPVDHETAGVIIDDELFQILVAPLKPGVRLTALFDSCHSGTALDLPYVYSTKGVIKEPNMLKDAGAGLLSTAVSYAGGDLFGAVKSVANVARTVARGGKSKEIDERNKIVKMSPADVIFFSGCKDSQTSADSYENGFATGALSYAFVKVLSENGEQSYLTLLQNMRKLLKAKYSQKPQLSASHPIDLNLKFVM